MKTKKLFNSWIIWVLVGVVAVVLFLPMVFGNNSAKVDTSVGLHQLTSGNVTEAKMFDGDQRVDLKLRDALKVDGVDKGTTVSFYYSTARAEQVVDEINKANLGKFTDQPVESNWLLSMLGITAARRSWEDRLVQAEAALIQSGISPEPIRLVLHQCFDGASAGLSASETGG